MDNILTREGIIWRRTSIVSVAIEVMPYLHNINFRLTNSHGITFMITYIVNLLIQPSRTKVSTSIVFETKDTKKLDYYFGIENIVHIFHKIFICQWHYIVNLIFKQGMECCKSIISPHDRITRCKLTPFLSLA